MFSADNGAEASVKNPIYKLQLSGHICHLVLQHAHASVLNFLNNLLFEFDCWLFP